MQNDLTNDISVEQIELKGFSKSIAELEWLLLILVLLYYVSPGAIIIDKYEMVIAMLCFSAFVLAFHYLNFYTRETRWKLAIETWVMIIFITWVLWNTGKIESPLLNLYILVIIASSLTLGKLSTFLEVGLIGLLYFYMSHPVFDSHSFSVHEFSRFMAMFSPFVIIAYLTTMLAADSKYGAKLLKQLSETDEMTGFQNKRAFNISFRAELKKASRYNHSLAIMMIDADNLKDINDKLGHQAGDRLIKMLADTIQEVLRETDIISRFGGDEFVALLPEADTKMAQEVAERIRSAVSNTSFDMKGNKVSATVSIGVAGFPDMAKDSESLLEKADRALYKSKQLGRNRVSTFSYKKAQAEHNLNTQEG